MAKPPSIPAILLINALWDECPSVVYGFINVIMRWIDKGNTEKPLEEKLRTMSRLSPVLWHNHKERILELLNEFYGPFLKHWYTRLAINGKMSTQLSGMRDRLNIKVKKSKMAEIPALKDEMSEFSIQPHRLERTHERTTRFVTDTPRKSTPPAPFKPGLKDT